MDKGGTTGVRKISRHAVSLLRSRNCEGLYKRFMEQGNNKASTEMGEGWEGERGGDLEKVH